MCLLDIRRGDDGREFRGRVGPLQRGEFRRALVGVLLLRAGLAEHPVRLNQPLGRLFAVDPRVGHLQVGDDLPDVQRLQTFQVGLGALGFQPVDRHLDLPLQDHQAALFLLDAEADRIAEKAAGAVRLAHHKLGRRRVQFFPQADQLLHQRPHLRLQRPLIEPRYDVVLLDRLVQFPRLSRQIRQHAGQRRGDIDAPDLDFADRVRHFTLTSPVP